MSTLANLLVRYNLIKHETSTTSTILYLHPAVTQQSSDANSFSYSFSVAVNSVLETFWLRD